LLEADFCENSRGIRKVFEEEKCRKSLYWKVEVLNN
jgi:hypothetical protein